MTNDEIVALLESQRAYFREGCTLSVDFRMKQLKKLHQAIVDLEKEIQIAIKMDLGKCDYEGFMCETGLVLSEIHYMIRNTKKLSRRKRVKTPITQFPANSYKQPVPYGNVLIMSPWNYPFLLTLEPLVDAIAAGNTAIVKPSAYSPETGKVIEKLLMRCFPPEYVAVVTGGREENSALLDQKFDLVFFTGSQAVGREVLRHTAEHLTPAVLELGGKSPCIVDETANIPLAARRIVFGKYLNCGQTCVAPDYILCHESVKDRFLQEVVEQIKHQYGENPLKNPDYGKIINEKHYKRLMQLLDSKKIIIGGESDPDTFRIAPTVMDNVNWTDAVMLEEIFGPIMPVISYQNFDEMVDRLKKMDKPLALYLFSQDRKRMRKMDRELSYGGGCMNDVVVHLATSYMGFGGMGESGMGSYHGVDGFRAFSHDKSVMEKKTWLDLPMRYQPYQKKRYGKLLRNLMK